MEQMFIPVLSYYSPLPGKVKGGKWLGRASGIKDSRP